MEKIEYVDDFIKSIMKVYKAALDGSPILSDYPNDAVYQEMVEWFRLNYEPKNNPDQQEKNP